MDERVGCVCGWIVGSDGSAGQMNWWVKYESTDRGDESGLMDRRVEWTGASRMNRWIGWIGG